MAAQTLAIGSMLLVAGSSAMSGAYKEQTASAHAVQAGLYSQQALSEGESAVQDLHEQTEEEKQILRLEQERQRASQRVQQAALGGESQSTAELLAGLAGSYDRELFALREQEAGKARDIRYAAQKRSYGFLTQAKSYSNAALYTSRQNTLSKMQIGSKFIGGLY